MRNTLSHGLRRKRLGAAVALAMAALAASDAALAQDTPAPPADDKAADGQPMQKVLVTTTRASQQSSIDRKKNAATAMDSIVAEDVGALPDRNIGEAISRMAGIALDRGEFGEGVTVAVRGNSADLTRVELDGQGVQAAGGADLGGTSGASGRAVEFRQLSSDLIKSVDVVKGSTADMTEGSLGGGIVIKTRTGLDFKKPFVSVRVAGSQNSLDRQWKPDANLILADKFLDGRLGLLLNLTSTTLASESHSVQTAYTALQGYYRALDFDNSPQKTFSFQPNTLNMADASVNQPLLQSPLIGGGSFNSATPLSVLTQSAAARTKADCYAAFPALGTDALNKIVAASRGAAQVQRGNELITCLNQWNDYTPSFLRYFVKREVDRRQNLDLRADYKVNNALMVYAKGSYNRRRDEFHQLTYGLGNLSTNSGVAITPAYTGPTYTDDTVNGVRSAVPGSGYYLYDFPTARSNAYPLAGTVANVIPGSVVTDANHHVTRYTITDGAATTDQLHDIVEVNAKYLQLGGTYKKGGLTAEFFIGDALSDFRRAPKRISYTSFFGQTTLGVLPNGLWGYSFPSGGAAFDQSDPARYVTLFPATSNSGAQALGPYNTRYVPAYTIGQQPLMSTTSPRTEAFYSPQIKETEERTAKLDVTWATPESVPFFKRFKSGFNLRDNFNRSWAGDGRIVQDAVGTYGQAGYQAPIIVPTATARTVVQACQDTPGSLGPGGKACQYGYTPVADPRSALNGTLIVTPAQWQNLIAQSLTGKAATTSFFSGASGRPAGLIDNWTQIDVDKAFAIIGAPNNNYDCVKSCTANDGKVYDQPVTRLQERTQAFYVMGDFGIDHVPFTNIALPFGWEIEGNIGYRYIRTMMSGAGSMTLNSISRTAAYDPLDPNKEGGTVTNKYVSNVPVESRTHDFLPSYNLAMWAIPDKLVLRYNRARTAARPPVYQLLPSGNCTYDQTKVDAGGGEVPQSCSGTIGNPVLMAQKNLNRNWSLEAYPNKDTMFSVAVFKQKGIVGPATAQGVNAVPLFSGSALIDPGSGADLSQVPFNYSQWTNGMATTRKGLEVGTKAAFTFLPWLLRYTGFDANYTRLRSVTTTQNAVDLLSGEPLPPEKESKYTYNWALWYDDGRLSARVAVQAVASYFTCIAGCSQQAAIQNYPAVGVYMTKFPYNPGSPNFRNATRYIDAKIGYKIKPNVEIFVEGRNLGNATTTNSQGSYTPFADGTPNLLDYSYAGRRIMVGLNFRTL